MKKNDNAYPGRELFLFFDNDAFSFASSRRDFVQSKLVQFYKIPENLSWISARQSATKQRVNRKKRENVVVDGYGVIRTEKIGAVPQAVSSLVLFEQPPTNYSFFSSCRDAVACRFNTPVGDIPTVVQFMRDWLDYMCYLPEEILNSISNPLGGVVLQHLKIKKEKHASNQHNVDKPDIDSTVEGIETD